MNGVLILTYYQLAFVGALIAVLVWLGLSLIHFSLIRLWAKDRFKKLDEKLNEQLDDLDELKKRTTDLEYSRDVDIYTERGDDNDEAGHG